MRAMLFWRFCTRFGICTVRISCTEISSPRTCCWLPGMQSLLFLVLIVGIILMSPSMIMESLLQWGWCGDQASGLWIRCENSTSRLVRWRVNKFSFLFIMKIYVWLFHQGAVRKCSVRHVAHPSTLLRRWFRRRNTAPVWTCGSCPQSYHPLPFMFLCNTYSKQSFANPFVFLWQVFWSHSVHLAEWICAFPGWRWRGSLWKNLCRVLLLPGWSKSRVVSMMCMSLKASVPLNLTIWIIPTTSMGTLG